MRGIALAVIGSILLASCAHPNQPSHPPQSEPVGVDAVPRDTTNASLSTKPVNPDKLADKQPDSSGAQAGAEKGLLGRIFGGKTASKAPKKQILAGAQAGPRKCKGCTIVYSAGPATVTTNTVGKKATAATADGATVTTIGKAKGPTAIGDSAAAQDFTKQAQRGGAAASGQGATATATTVKPPTPWLKYGLWALGAVGGYWLLFGGGGALLLALWRRNKSNPNQA